MYRELTLLTALLLCAGCATRQPRVSTYGPPPPVSEPTPSATEEYRLLLGDALTAEEQQDLRALRLARYEPPPGASPPQLDPGLSDLLAEEGSALIHEQVGYDIPIVLNDRVWWWMDYFVYRIPDSFSRYLARSGAWLDYLKAELEAAGLPEDLVYLALIESGFSTRAVSHAGAVGPWQFMPYTGREYGLRIDRWVDERRDYERATQAAIAYLSDLHDMLGSWYLAAAGYNGGQGRVGRSMARENTINFWELTGLHEETRNYVPKLIAATVIAKEPEKYGFTNIDYMEPVEWAKVTVLTSTDLDVVAEAAEVPVQVISSLNPHLLRGRTPPGETNFPVKIPADRVDEFNRNYIRLTPDERIRAPLVHLVRAGETPAGIASAYDVQLEDLLAENGIRANTRLEHGQRLIVPGRSARSDGTYPDLEPLEPGVGADAERDPTTAAPPPAPRPARGGGETAERPAAGASRTHVVRSGETLYGIARRYDVTVEGLKRSNGLRSNTISAGARLRIP